MNDSVWSPLNLDFLSPRLGFAIPEAKAGPPRWTRDGGKTWQPRPGSCRAPRSRGEKARPRRRGSRYRWRVLATLLFTDIVDSTARAAAVGDRAWADVLARHHRLVRAEVARFRGQEIDTAGDGIFASFDGHARAVRCASSIVSAVRRLGIEVRAGVHTGEIERSEDGLRGIAVHLAARIVSAARPGEVLVSNTVKDIVAGSGIQFRERGEHELAGVPGRWRFFSVDAS
jgi:class 3 adenylate cyclase